MHVGSCVHVKSKMAKRKMKNYVHVQHDKEQKT